MHSKLIIDFILVGLGTVWATSQTSDAASQRKVTLLGTLAAWMYPGSNFVGASMSDGGNRRIQSAKCQAILTTRDSVEKVTKFYSEKFVSGPQDAEKQVKGADAQSVSTQDTLKVAQSSFESSSSTGPRHQRHSLSVELRAKRKRTSLGPIICALVPIDDLCCAGPGSGNNRALRRWAQNNS